MGHFEPIPLEWSGKKYLIPADNVLRVIAQIEDVLTLGQLASAQSHGRLPLAKIAIAFGIALRHAGAEVSDEDVYNGMFSAGGAELQRRALTAVFTLQAMMVPPEHLRANPGKANGGAAGSPAASSPSATDSSSQANRKH